MATKTIKCGQLFSAGDTVDNVFQFSGPSATLFNGVSAQLIWIEIVSSAGGVYMAVGEAIDTATQQPMTTGTKIPVTVEQYDKNLNLHLKQTANGDTLRITW